MKNRIFNHINRLKSKLIFDAWSVSNKRHPDEYIRVLFIGKGFQFDKDYLRSLIFKENYNENYLGKVWIWRIFFFFWGLRKNHDLIIFKTSMKWCNIFKIKNCYVIPNWISCEIDLCCDLKSQTISKNTFTYNLRIMRKSNFEYTITKDPKYFQIFYHKMYLPYLLNRHGSMGLKINSERMKRSFENGELLLIKDEKKIIAGALIDYKRLNGIPRIVQLGVLGGDFNYVKKGALVAIYYYTIEYLRKRNFEKFSVGYSRPFIYDGITRHKLQWGANIVCETSHVFLLSILSNRICIKTFLVNNPFICKDRKRLSLATFTDGNSKEFKKYDKYRNKLN